MMLRWVLAVLAIGAMFGAGSARADHQPAIAIPGKRGVPVIVNGQNATGAVVIGDWGLHRPGHMGVTVIRRQPWHAWRYYRRHRVKIRKTIVRGKPVVRRKVVARPKVIVRTGPRHFFPGGTTPPKLGRVESDVRVGPPPVPAESFSRSWSAGSRNTPATIPETPVVTSPVIIDNRFRPKPKP